MMPTTQSEASESPRIAVIGAGITGLAAAHHLIELGEKNKQKVQVELFDSSERVGGVMGTEQIAGYCVERGADMFITEKPGAVELCERLGLSDRFVAPLARHRRSLVLHRGRPVPLPEGFMLMAPSRFGPMVRTPLLSLGGKLRMALDLLLPRADHAAEESLAEFVTRRFGRELLDRLVQPLVGGIYTADPERLSLTATLPRFIDMEREHRSVILGALRQAKQRDQPKISGSGARYGMFLSLMGGMSELINALHARIDKEATVRLETSVDRVSYDERGGCRIHVSGQAKPERFDAALLALPSYRAADLLRETAPHLANLLEAIEYASSAVVVSGHALADIRHPVDAFGLVMPAIEKRKLLAVSFSSRKFPGRAPEGKVLLRSFVGGALQPELLEQSDQELVAMVQGELRELLGVGGKPDFTAVYRYRRAMPQYHVGHLDRVAAIERELLKEKGLELAGNAYHGVGVPDCVYSGERAAERLMADC